MGSLFIYLSLSLSLFFLTLSALALGWKCQCRCDLSSRGVGFFTTWQSVLPRPAVPVSLFLFLSKRKKPNQTTHHVFFNHTDCLLTVERSHRLWYETCRITVCFARWRTDKKHKHKLFFLQWLMPLKSKHIRRSIKSDQRSTALPWAL